jgi:transposase
MMCKDNSAAVVRQITPQEDRWRRGNCAIHGDLWAHCALTRSMVRHSYNYTRNATRTRFGVPASKDRKRSKADALAEDGTLNPAPEKVRDPKFQEDGFFDPRDIVQVKYEMLRRASVEKASVTDVSDEYGVSRPTYYQAKADFEEGGIAGLVPKKRGPRGAHKIQGEALAFIEAQISPGAPIRARDLAKLLQKELSLDVHPRTIERVVRAKKASR